MQNKWIINTLRTLSNTPLAPRTVEKAIQDEQGILLSEKLQAMQIKINENATSYAVNIDSNFTFHDLIHQNEVILFTNWTDSQNFPDIYGNGIYLPGSDPRNNCIIYSTCAYPIFNEPNLHKRKIFIGYVYRENPDSPIDGLEGDSIVWQELVTNNNIDGSNFFINPDFSVNQRNMTEYITNKSDMYGKFYPDRWRCLRDYNDNGLRFTIEDDGLHAKFLSPSGSYGGLIYTFEQELSRFLSGKTVTLSIQFKVNNGCFRGFTLLEGETTIINNFTDLQKSGVFTRIIKLPETITKRLKIKFMFSSSIEEGEIIFQYAKLELGTCATTFIAPDPTQELLKCMRFYQEEEVHYRPSSENSTLLIPNKALRTVPMRIVPTISISSLNGASNKFSIANGTADTTDIISQIYNNHAAYYPAILVNNTPLNESKVARFKSDAEIF